MNRGYKEGQWEVTDNWALRPQGPAKVTHYWKAPSA